MQFKWFMMSFALAVLLCIAVPSMADDSSEEDNSTTDSSDVTADEPTEPTESTESVYSVSNLDIENMFKKIYHDESNIKKENQSFRDKVLALYYSCQHAENFTWIDAIDKAVDILWPMIQDLKALPQPNWEQIDTYALLGKLFSYGFNDFIFHSSVHREANGSLHIELDLPSARWLGEDSGILEAQSIVKDLGRAYEDDQVMLPKTTKYLTEMEMFIALVNDTCEVYKEEHIETFTFEQIKQLYPKMVTFFNAMFVEPVKDDDIVVFKNVKYIDYLTAQNWKADEIRSFLNYAYVNFYQFASKMDNTKCADVVRSQMMDAVNYMYRQHLYASEIGINSKTFKDLTEEQLETINDSLGNIPEHVDDAVVEKFYQDWPNMDINNFNKNIIVSFQQKFWQDLNCPEVVCVMGSSPSAENSQDFEHQI